MEKHYDEEDQEEEELKEAFKLSQKLIEVSRNWQLPTCGVAFSVK